MKGSPAGTAPPQPINFRAIAPGALVIFATVLAYLPALSGGFIWNDSDYVTAPALRSLKGLAGIWTDLGATQQYYPLLHSAFWVQHRLFGDHPLGYHMVTLLLHALSALLFGLILRRLFAGGPAQSGSGVAWLAALLFALHPVHAESVAWITEQKNTLSLFFYLASAAVYLRFDETRRPLAYFLALALFVASLGCKTVTATLPAALLVVFWWKRGRLGWRRDVLPLWPWLVIGMVAGMFSSWVERIYGGARGADFDLSAAGRVLVAGRAVWFYAGKLACPFNLNFVYPRWTVDAASSWQWLFPLGVLALGAVLWILRRRTRGPLAAYLLFVGSLFPVLGFVNLFGSLYSRVWDHWQYLADLGPLALAAAGLSAAWRRWAPRRRLLGTALAAALAVFLGALTWAHCAIFHDDLTLYRATLARNQDCWLAHNNLGLIWWQTPGRLDDAIAEYRDALRLNPNYAEAHNNLGLALSQLPGRQDEAIAQYREALRLMPFFVEAHYNLGLALSQSPGRLDDAIAQYNEALRLRPGYFEAHSNLGIILSKMPGRLNDAIAQYEEALRLMPNSAVAHFNLGNAWLQMPGRLDDAIAQYKEAVRLQPDYVSAWQNLGVSWFELGNRPQAAAAFREWVSLSPNDPSARQALAAALQEAKGR